MNGLNFIIFKMFLSKIVQNIGSKIVNVETQAQ